MDGNLKAFEIDARRRFAKFFLRSLPHMIFYCGGQCHHLLLRSLVHPRKPPQITFRVFTKDALAVKVCESADLFNRRNNGSASGAVMRILPECCEENVVAGVVHVRIAPFLLFLCVFCIGGLWFCQTFRGTAIPRRARRALGPCLSGVSRLDRGWPIRSSILNRRSSLAKWPQGLAKWVCARRCCSSSGTTLR